MTRRFEKKKKNKNEQEDGSRGGMEKRVNEEAMEQRKKSRKSRRIVYPPLESSFCSFSPSPSRSSLSLSHARTHTYTHFFCSFFFSLFFAACSLLEERDILLGVFPIVVVFGFVFPAKFPAYKLLPPFCLEFSLVSPLRFPLFLFSFFPSNTTPALPTDATVHGRTAFLA